MVDSKIVALGALALGATQLNSQGGSSQKQKTTPAMAGGGGTGSMGLALGRPRNVGGQPQQTPGPQITLEAPNPEINTTVQPGNTNVGGTPAGGSSSSGSKSKSSSKDKKSSSRSVSAQDYDVPEVDMGEDDSGDGNPQTDTGIQAADTPGVQSSKPSDVTAELNMQQGYTRTQTTAEMDNPPEAEIDVGGGTKNKSSKSSKQKGSSGGGGFFDSVDDTVDDAVDAGSSFLNDTIGWGDV
jgi:hypothetical protein